MQQLSLFIFKISLNCAAKVFALLTKINKKRYFVKKKKLEVPIIKTVAWKRGNIRFIFTHEGIQFAKKPQEN